MKNSRVVVISSENTHPTWRWIARHFNTIDWSFYLPQKSKAAPVFIIRMLVSLKAVIKAAKSDILVSHGPYMAFYCAFFKWCFCIRTPHVVYSFNFAELPQGFALKRIQFVFKKIDKLVVSSRMEIDLYSAHIKIPADKFDFVHWGVNCPEFKNTPPKRDSDYICAVGGNARDYATFMDAMRDLPDIPAIIVVRPHNLVGLQVPDNVTVLTNIPKDEAYSVIANSRFMVLPLKGNEVPCGHVTIVVAFYMGIPSIVTDSSGIDDYITDGETGVLCDPGSKESMKQAIVRLWQDPVLCTTLSDKGKVFAESKCSEQNYVAHFNQFIKTNVTSND
ncbi:MAG: glycosyltransferase family 4 protein [Methyloglobulus sp.]